MTQNGMWLLPVASCPWILREVSLCSCSLCGSFAVSAARFFPPLCRFLQIASIKGKAQVSGLVVILGVLSPLSWSLPECKLFRVTEVHCICLLARACTEQGLNRMQGPWRWGGLNGLFEALDGLRAWLPRLT